MFRIRSFLQRGAEQIGIPEGVSAPLLVGDHQIESVARPGHRDIEQTAVFVCVVLIENGIRLRDGGEKGQESLSRRMGHPLRPERRILFHDQFPGTGIDSVVCVQLRHDHQIEIQAFGFVDGHKLHGLADGGAFCLHAVERVEKLGDVAFSGCVESGGGIQSHHHALHVEIRKESPEESEEALQHAPETVRGNGGAERCGDAVGPAREGASLPAEKAGQLEQELVLFGDPDHGKESARHLISGMQRHLQQIPEHGEDHAGIEQQNAFHGNGELPASTAFCGEFPELFGH